MAEATPWLKLLAVAQQLGLAPAPFWRLSLKEWRALVAPANDVLTRSGLEALLQLFPDEEDE